MLLSFLFGEFPNSYLRTPNTETKNSQPLHDVLFHERPFQLQPEDGNYDVSSFSAEDALTYAKHVAGDSPLSLCGGLTSSGASDLKFNGLTQVRAWSSCHHLSAAFPSHRSSSTLLDFSRSNLDHLPSNASDERHEDRSHDRDTISSEVNKESTFST